MARDREITQGTALGPALAQAVRARRERAGLSQGELAKMAGVASGTLSMLEAGLGNPTVGTLASLAEVLGCEISDLFGDGTDPMVRHLHATDAAPAAGALSGSRLLHRFAPNGPVEIYSAELSRDFDRLSTPHAAGVYEHIWLAAGALVAGPESEPVEMKPGDYLCFPAWVPHIYKTGAKGARFLGALSYTRSLWGTRDLLGHGRDPEIEQ